MAEQETTNVLSIRGMCKSFGRNRVLDHIDLDVKPGSIMGLMGENGAGKSTLIKVLTGVYEKDAGSIQIEGCPEEAHIHSPQQAQDIGISTVYQEITLCPYLTVAENMFIGRTKDSIVHWKEYERRATEILDNLGIPARATQELSRCSLAVQQMVAIARAVDMNCKVLILDEPTSSLDDNEVKLLFDVMNQLKAEGMGIIFITLGLLPIELCVIVLKWIWGE
jgi:simple sugar transport system ATP-binding protein